MDVNEYREHTDRHLLHAKALQDNASDQQFKSRSQHQYFLHAGACLSFVSADDTHTGGLCATGLVPCRVQHRPVDSADHRPRRYLLHLLHLLETRNLLELVALRLLSY